MECSSISDGQATERQKDGSSSLQTAVTVLDHIRSIISGSTSNFYQFASGDCVNGSWALYHLSV